MEKRRAIYELPDIENFSRGSVAHPSLAAAKRGRLQPIDPAIEDLEDGGKEREQLALEIYAQAMLAKAWLSQNDRSGQLAARSQRGRLIDARAAWISAIAATTAALLAFIFLR
jgi:hypothetical protein